MVEGNTFLETFMAIKFRAASSLHSGGSSLLQRCNTHNIPYVIPEFTHFRQVDINSTTITYQGMQQVMAPCHEVLPPSQYLFCSYSTDMCHYTDNDCSELDGASDQ